jgi:hypothetical protein
MGVMKRRLALLILLSHVILRPAAALDLSHAPGAYLSPCAVALALGRDLEELSGYSPSPRCPRIAFTLPPAGESGPAQLGEYHPESGLITLAADLDLSTPWGRSVLLHEMVHAAQHAQNGLPECRAAMEFEAYAAQAAYLRRHEMLQEATLLFVFGSLVSTCGDPEFHS